MTSSTHPSKTQTFSSLYTHLLRTYPPPLHPINQSPRIPSSQIASLALHPTLETTLHILNADLPSAHFLVRHMSAPPKVEGMLLHAILHRVEGDYENSRAWYRNVAAASDKREGEGEEGEDGKGVFEHVWLGGLEEVRGFLGRVEGFVKRKKGRRKGKGGKDEDDNEEEEEEQKKLEKESQTEIERVVEWCRRKFGEGEVRDASEAWVRPSEEHRRMGEDMVVGGEGWRVF